MGEGKYERRKGRGVHGHKEEGKRMGRGKAKGKEKGGAKLVNMTGI